LRCTGCDFAVSSFNDVQWSDDTDYLFLRNNMPDFHRVRTKLVPKKGASISSVMIIIISLIHL
jgi:Retinal Maintenance